MKRKRVARKRKATSYKPKIRSVRKIARRGYYTRAKRSYKRSGGYKGMLAPIAGGAGDVIAAKFIPIHGVGSTVAGMFLGDQITMKIGLNKIGESLGVMFAGNGGYSNGGGL